MANVFDGLPKELGPEQFDDLLKTDAVRIERIVSKGHCSPEQGWYDQHEHEWVMVLEGCGTLLFDDGRELVLGKGDYVHIPAHVRHRETHTDPDQLTVWLAVFYG
jgi:cupin 2 domain-containing protein